MDPPNFIQKLMGSEVKNYFNVPKRIPDEIDLLVTLWPSFPHFSLFTNDHRICGVRLNSAMIETADLDAELSIINSTEIKTPLYYDVKGWQVRVEEVFEYKDHLELTLNHCVYVKTPQVVLFKAGEDSALLLEIKENGKRLIFDRGPRLEVRKGESIHVRHPSYLVHGPIFTQMELEKIEKVKSAGFKKFFLSYVNSQKYVDQFLEIVGHDSEVWLKIESNEGLQYVTREFQKKDNLTLVAACGDLYVEIERPHQIMDGLKSIIEADPKACVGSRMLLSINNGEVPSLADFLQLAWLYDLGFKKMMLCDEICLKEDLLLNAVAVFDAFRQNYKKTK